MKVIIGSTISPIRPPPLVDKISRACKAAPSRRLLTTTKIKGERAMEHLLLENHSHHCGEDEIDMRSIRFIQSIV